LDLAGPLEVLEDLVRALGPLEVLVRAFVRAFEDLVRALIAYGSL
jgi:hypothetical protein